MTIKTTVPSAYGHSMLFRFCFFIMAMMILTGIGCSSKAVSSAPAHTNNSTEFQLRKAAGQWLSTPHRMGGLDRRGIDCSGLVKVLYQEIFDIRLPRTTKLQVRHGMAVQRGEIAPGDLVFFKPPHKVRHVGIYLGNGEFLHASTRRGVIISRLSEVYWRNSYWTARRVIPS